MQAQTNTRTQKAGRPRWRVVFCLVTLLLAGRVSGDSVTLRPDADTSISAAYPDNNQGSNPTLVAGANGSGFASRALLRFDVASRIPSHAVIQSVTLAVNVVIVPGGGGVSSMFNLRRVLQDWGEGGGTSNFGSPAGIGDATWENRAHPSNPWTVPGGGVASDFSQTVSASTLINGLGSFTFASSNLVADVQQWVSSPQTNFGWALASESEDTAFTSRRFASREDEINAPLLTVHYVLPIEIQGIKAIAGQMQISFVATEGQPFTVQYRNSLSVGNWLTLTNLAPPATTTNLTVIDPSPIDAQRSYRVGAF